MPGEGAAHPQHHQHRDHGERNPAPARRLLPGFVSDIVAAAIEQMGHRKSSKIYRLTLRPIATPAQGEPHQFPSTPRCARSRRSGAFTCKQQTAMSKKLLLTAGIV